MNLYNDMIVTKNRVIAKSYAKINLMLDINYRRSDNYHDLFMIMQSVGIFDTISVEKIKGRNQKLSIRN